MACMSPVFVQPVSSQSALQSFGPNAFSSSLKYPYLHFSHTDHSWRLIFTPFTLSMVSSNTQLKSLSRNPSTHQEPKETTQKNCFAFNLIIDIVTSIKKSIYIFKWLGSSKPRILFLDRQERHKIQISKKFQISGPINKVLSEYSHIHLLFSGRGCFPVTTAG